MSFLFHVSDSTPAGIGGIDEYTKLMLHGDESPLVDSSNSEHTVTPTGQVARSVTQSKFGGYSIYFDGSGDWLKMPVHADWTCSSDFTIDFWLYTADTALKGLFTSDNWVTNGSFIFYKTAAGLALNFTVGGVPTVIMTYGTPLSDSTWHHIAITRSASTMRLFVDGDSKDTYSNSNPFGLGSLAIGTDWNGAYVGGQPEFTIDGYIDEFRWSKGIARWTSNFTPETGPYTT